MFSTTAGFCNDRVIAVEDGDNIKYLRFYNFSNRVDKYEYQFTCPQENDLFTLKNSGLEIKN